MTDRQLYRFAGTDGPVDVTGCDAVSRYFPAVFSNWPHEKLPAQAQGEAPVLKLSPDSKGYHLTSQQYVLNQHLNDPLNAACSIMAELAWARLRAEPDLLCFHGAALEYNGSLVLIPSQRKAGKSTLTACLVARGRRLFTDDFLPLRLGRDGGLYGIANGSAPRLRLPLPDEFSPDIKRRIMWMAGPQNKQYLYLSPKDGQLAAHGESLPVSAIVLLNRGDGLDSSVSAAGSVELMRRLILQNFSRHMNPARILGMIGHMAKHTHGLKLSYSNAEDASALLDAHLEEITTADRRKPISALPQLEPEDLPLSEEPAIRSDQIERDAVFKQASSTFELDFETDSFVASSTGGGIHHLDSIARAAWGLLAEPISLNEMTALFSEAFPDQDRDVISRDMTKTMRFLRDQRLIDRVEAV